MDTMPDTLDIFSTKRFRPARPQISTTPVRRVEVGANLPRQAGDDRAEELDAARGATPPRALFSGAQAKARPAGLMRPAPPMAPMQQAGQPSQFGDHQTGGAVTYNGMRHEVGVAGGNKTPQAGAASRGGMTRVVPPNQASQAGIATRGDRSIVVPPANAASAAPAQDITDVNGLTTPATPVASPTTTARPQTESNNPLTGDTNQQAGGTTAAVNPALSLGYNQRGGSVPAGTDAVNPGATVGGGISARKFSNPRASDIYSQFIRGLFSKDSSGVA